MPIQILMPALSPTMTEGTVAKWLKREGDVVESGDVLAEIETDKATMEIEAVDEGVLAKILIGEGTEGVAINTPIAVLLEEGEDASALDGMAAPPAPAPAAAASATPAPPAPAPQATPAPAPAPASAAAPTGAGERLLASPLAMRMAAEAGLDLRAVAGSGPHGRVVKRDIEAALAAGPAPAATPAPAAAPSPAVAPVPAPAAAPALPPTASAEGLPPYHEISNSTVRKVVARRLTESKQQVPHFYLSVDCELDKLLALRKDLNARSPEGADAYKLSVNDFIIRAAALALIKVPAANAMWTEAAIRRFTRADISVAVAIDGGLITPIVRGADAKGLTAISGEMKDLAARARAGTLAPEEFQGGTFTVSNLGMYGIREFGAIINPPQGCILAVGAGAQRPIVRDGALAIATVMTCTLSVDHRVVDGAVGAEFMAAFKPLIEDPLTMLL